MSKMDGCCGEVRLAETESYKKWGIEIRVRFRSVEDQGKMAVLDKRVHSGGERSVSTILYLMALQASGGCPRFRSRLLGVTCVWFIPWG